MNNGIDLIFNEQFQSNYATPLIKQPQGIYTKRKLVSYYYFFFCNLFLTPHYVVADTPSFAISREPGFGFPITEGIPVSLKCDVDANPRAFPIWQKDDSAPPVQQSPDGFLNFTEIRREHSGWYKCIARHQLGRFSSIGYFLNVRCEYRIFSLKLFRKNIQITCVYSTNTVIKVKHNNWKQLK